MRFKGELEGYFDYKSLQYGMRGGGHCYRFSH